jgi:CPA2 family monovalent cation:H+ antiporter-2
MLFDPAVVVERPWPLLATVIIIVFGKSIAAYGIVRAFGHPNRTALTISASLAQIGEFSFILAGLGAGLGILPTEGRDLILAGAIISIFLNPFVFTAVAGRVGAEKERDRAAGEAMEMERQRERRDHTILVGFGRVGRIIGESANEAGRALVVIEDQPDTARAAVDLGLPVVVGNATATHVLREAGIAQATRLVIAIPEGFEAGAIAERARKANPQITILARAHSEAEVEHLEKLGVDQIVMGEREIARRLLELIRRKLREEA